jgi:UDP-N-acetyl-D-mannosaminuronic acid dehydrogenase
MPTSLTKSQAAKVDSADIAVVGGAGHVGLPLAIVLASKGLRVLIYDINSEVVNLIQKGTMPFLEYGAEPLLKDVLAQGLLSFSSNAADLANIPTIVITIGTPIDEFLNPALKGMIQCFEPLLPYLSDDQLLILRSTVYPGMTEWLDKYLRSQSKHCLIAFCPERIVQGHSIEELQKLPQIVSGTTEDAEERAAEVFLQIAPSVVRLKPIEAEFAKLFANAYRYIQFATSNQFYMMANTAGLDYYRILQGMKQDYPRMRDIPSAGLAAGPCLFKDTMQLTAFCDNEFSLGNSAMLINEGLPLYVVNRIARKWDLSQVTIGLLGMAFKANCDDQRSSLSYKLKKVLLFRAKGVLTTDPLVANDPDLLPLEEVLNQSDLLILCTPHQAYKSVDLKGKPVIDLWNFFGNGGLI